MCHDLFHNDPSNVTEIYRPLLSLVKERCSFPHEGQNSWRNITVLKTQKNYALYMIFFMPDIYIRLKSG